jgi:hypothetical protein
MRITEKSDDRSILILSIARLTDLELKRFVVITEGAEGYFIGYSDDESDCRELLDKAREVYPDR